jgi:REP element-mobilizing transposase RayT
VPDATYFVTGCTEGKRDGLNGPGVSDRIHAELDGMHRDESIAFRVGTVMPDHIHVLFRLGKRLTLGQVLGRLKSKTRTALAGRGIAWQESFFDHRLQPDEPALPIFHYIFMNPYRKGIAAAGEQWHGFRCSSEDWEWFQHHLNDGCPYPEWLTAM